MVRSGKAAKLLSNLSRYYANEDDNVFLLLMVCVLHLIEAVNQWGMLTCGIKNGENFFDL